MSQLLDEIIMAIGVLLVALGLRMFARTRSFVAKCRNANGRITHYTTEESADEGVWYYARVRFRDASGVEHEIAQSTGLRQPPTVGEEVRITYDPSYPTNAWISGSAAPWFLPWFVLILGLAVVAGGFVVRAEG